MRDMLSVYIRRPAGLDLAEQPFPLMMEVGTALRRGARDELGRGSSPRRRPICSSPACSAWWSSTPGSVADRRDELVQLAALFLAEPTRRAAPER